MLKIHFMQAKVPKMLEKTNTKYLPYIDQSAKDIRENN